MGPVAVTPTLRVGSIGIDSNVFYTPTERRADFIASGGPGLILQLPLGRSVLVRADGGIDFLYFARTESQRRVSGYGSGGLEWTGARTEVRGGVAYKQSFGRPAYEIDERIFEENRSGLLELQRRIGRMTFVAAGSARKLEIEQGSEFNGTDLSRNLNRNTYKVLGGFHIGLSQKTSLILEADQEWERFIEAPARDIDSNRFYGGLRLESQTRLSGQAVAGARRFRPLVSGTQDWLPYVRVDVNYSFGPRTRLGLGVLRDQIISAYDTSGNTPTSSTTQYDARLQKALWRGLDIRFFGGIRTLETDGEIVIVDPVGNMSTGVRKDDTWEAGANLGYAFWDALRVGVELRYSDRHSTFDDFGVDGLVVGFTINYVPGDLLAGLRTGR